MHARLALLAAFAVAAALAAGACGSARDRAHDAAGIAEAPLAAADPASLGREAAAEGIEQFAAVAPGIFRGAQPEGSDASFAFLAKLGVRTALSVDGAAPDVEAASRHGIRYVHVPVEYSGISPAEQARIARVVRDLPAALFVHCHHGKHRGPTAAVMAWMYRDGVSPERAVAEMRRAGTDPRYAGLYADAGAWRRPKDEAVAAITDAELPSVAPVEDIIAAMVAIDGSFDRMKAVRKAGWATPPDHPDVIPAHEARILAERFRELARLDEAKGKPADFRAHLAAAEESSWAVETALRASDATGAAKALDRVGASCASCHETYRDRHW